MDLDLRDCLAFGNGERSFQRTTIYGSTLLLGILEKNKRYKPLRSLQLGNQDIMNSCLSGPD